MNLARNRNAKVVGFVAAPLLVALVSFAGSPPSAHGESPDPIALLRGLEEARAAIRTGKLEMVVTKHQLRPSEQKDDIDLTIVFDGDKRTSRQRQRALVVNASGPDGGHAKRKQLVAMNEDRDAFVRAGLGSWRDDHIRSGWDGSNFCQYSETMGASYRSHKQGTPDLVFDPRLLGLLASYEMTKTLQDCLYYQKARSVTLVGSEEVGDHLTWHVLVTSAAGVERHFWIEDKEGFRLRKFMFKDSSVNKTIVSEYDAKAKAGVLPTLVTTQTLDKNDRVTRRVVVRVTKAELGAAVDPAVGTLVSLGLPVGEPVSDERIHQRLGYWDGEGLVSELRQATEIGQQRQVAAEQERTKRYWRLGIIGSGLVALMVFLLRWRRGPTNPAGKEGP